MRPFLPVAVLLFAGCGRDAGAERLSVLLITLDTTRAAALGCYGNPHGATPALDRLAAESVLYEQARTVAPITLPAHASMLTGLYPPRHTVRDNGLRPLPQAAATLAEAAAAAGYATAAFVAAVVLDRPYGLDQGFAVYDAPRPDPKQQHIQIAERPAAEVTAAALAWFERLERRRPFCAWVHYFDPHEPYDPQPRFVQQVGEGRPYLAEVAAMDHAVGELLEALRAQGRLERTLVIVAGDHGEDFGQHGEPTHSVTCYDTTLRVPFLIRYPGGYRAGVRTLERASVADVHPTALEAMGIAPPPDLDGQSLYRKQLLPDRGVYFESYAGYLNYGWSPLCGWLTAGGKYIHSSVPEYYDPIADPEERNNLFAVANTSHFRLALDALSQRPVLPADASLELSGEERAQLQALGYAAMGDPAEISADLLDASDRPSPHQRTGELNAFYQAVLLAHQGKRPEAVAALQALVADNPRNLYALDILGLYLHQEQRHAEAVAVLQSLLHLGGERATAHHVLGRCHEALGNRGQALHHFRRAAMLRPGDAVFQREVARLSGG